MSRSRTIWPRRQPTPRPKAFIRDPNHVPPHALLSEVSVRCHAMTARRSRCTLRAVRYAAEFFVDDRGQPQLRPRYCCQKHYLKKRNSTVRDEMGFGVIEWWPVDA